MNYTYDKAGRITAVNGAGYAGVSSYASALTYRAFGSLKGMNYANGRSLSTAYDNRLRPTTWNVASVLGYSYNYDYFNEHTGRVIYAQNIQDPTLDRSYEYDHAGCLVISHSGTEARAHAWTGQWSPIDGPYSQGYDYDVWGNVTHKYGWGGEVVGGDGSTLKISTTATLEPPECLQLRCGRQPDQRYRTKLYLRCNGAADGVHLHQSAKQL